jgi:hypothetical protein
LHCVTERGIELSNEFDMATTEERRELCQVIEKELTLCEVCNKPILPKDQIDWTIKKLGNLYVSNTSLIAFAQQKIGVKDPYPHTESGVFRWDRFRILCPRCRRCAVTTS